MFVFFIALLIGLFSLFLFLNYKTALTYKPSRERVVEILEKILNGQLSAYEWDEFSSIPIRHDSVLERIRQQCVDLQTTRYSTGLEDGFIFNELGLKEIEKILLQIGEEGDSHRKRG